MWTNTSPAYCGDRCFSSYIHLTNASFSRMRWRQREGRMPCEGCGMEGAAAGIIDCVCWRQIDGGSCCSSYGHSPQSPRPLISRLDPPSTLCPPMVFVCFPLASYLDARETCCCDQSLLTLTLSSFTSNLTQNGSFRRRSSQPKWKLGDAVRNTQPRLTNESRITLHKHIIELHCDSIKTPTFFIWL